MNHPAVVALVLSLPLKYAVDVRCGMRGRQCSRDVGRSRSVSLMLPHQPAVPPLRRAHSVSRTTAASVVRPAPAPSAQRFDWAAWRAWVRRCWEQTRWDTADINHVLDRRTTTPCAAHFQGMAGAIYGIYHFASRRWYVGQTMSTVCQRSQEHWWSRHRKRDAFHRVLGGETDPFSFVPLLLEFVRTTEARDPAEQRRNFRSLATPRERFWVERVNSLLPNGLNSVMPGGRRQDGPGDARRPTDRTAVDPNRPENAGKGK